MTGDSITAEIPSGYEKTTACIHQGTEHACQFLIGPNGVSQVEFDYHIEGDRWSNWFAFWLNPVGPGGAWIKDCEIDSLENMYQSIAMNFAGLGHQVQLKEEFGFDGHITTKTQDTGAQAMDCAKGRETCDFNGDYAHHEFGQGTINGIRNGTTRHHFVIDYWKAELKSKLTISNIRVKAGGQFNSMCPSATPE